MKKQLVFILFGGLVASSAFAYSTRPMTVVKGTDAAGLVTATCTFAEDTTGLVTKYNLYVVWADADAGRELAAWPNKRKVAEVTPTDSRVVVLFPNEALSARAVRVILGEPTFATRDDGLALIDYVEAKNAGAWVNTEYTPSGTASFDMTFAITNRPGKSNHATLFCARDLNQTDNATYTLFVQQLYDNGGYRWRLDYGNTSGGYTEGDLGFTHSFSPYRVQTSATGRAATMTLTKWNGENQSATTINSLVTAGSTLHLFGCLNKDGTKGNFGRFLCWGFRATDNGELKLNLLPAKKTETIEGVEKTTFGLYDTVAKKFLTSGDANKPLSADAAVTAPLEETSESFLFENDREAERSMTIVPRIPDGKEYATSVAISLPATNTQIPYSLEAVYPDGTTLPVAEIDDRMQTVTFAMPPHRKRANRQTLQFRLAPKLPVGYELVPYAIKTGSKASNGARIETDYKANGATVVATKMSVVTETLDGTPAATIFCSRSSAQLDKDNPGQCAFLTYSGTAKKFYWRYDYNAALGSSQTQGALDTVYTLQIGTPGGLQVTSETSSYVIDGARTAAEFEAKGEMMLFASYKGFTDSNGKRTFTDIGNSRGMHIYWLTVKDATGDIMTLVPVKCTAEGENQGKVGFWDFKNERFVKSSCKDEFTAPEGDETSPLVRLSEPYATPEQIGLVVIVY